MNFLIINIDVGWNMINRVQTSRFPMANFHRHICHIWQVLFANCICTRLQVYLKNSLIIHEENTKEMNV